MLVADTQLGLSTFVDHYHAGGSLYLRGKLGAVVSEVTAETAAQDVCLKYIIFATRWSFPKCVLKSIKVYQLCKHDFLRVKHNSSQKPENCDWRKPVSTASLYPICSLWIWNYCSLTCLSWPEVLGPPEKLSFAFSFIFFFCNSIFIDCSSTLQRKNYIVRKYLN